MQAGWRVVQHERLGDEPLEGKAPIKLKNKGLDNEPLKEEGLQFHEHEWLDNKLFEDKELLPFEDKYRQRAAQGRGAMTSRAQEARQWAV